MLRNVKRAEKIINALRTRWGKRAQVDYRSLCRILNREFKSLHVVFRFRARPENFKSNHPWFIEGFYTQRIPGVELDDPLYEIKICRKYNAKMFTVNKFFWNELYLVLAHEFKHGDQYRKRKNRVVFRLERKDLNPKADKYLCAYDEIDAHAFECALEMKLKGKPMMEISHAKKYYKKCRRKAMPEWRRFAKRVYKYSHQI